MTAGRSDANRSSKPTGSISLDRLSDAMTDGVHAQFEQVAETINKGVQREMAELSETINKSVQNQFAEMATSLRDAVVVPLLKVWAEIDERLKRMEPAAYSLGRSGWTVPTWGPLFLAEDLVQMIPQEQFDALFEHEYRADRRKLEREMFERLLSAPTLRRWEPLLAEVRVAYRRKHYLVAVPALLAVLEGSVVFAANRVSSKRQLQRVLNDELAKSTWSYGRVAWASLAGFVGVVFGSHQFSKTPPARLNRHWVMHGRDEPRWQRVDCLRLFQALDTLVAADSSRRWSEALKRS